METKGRRGAKANEAGNRLRAPCRTGDPPGACAGSHRGRPLQSVDSALGLFWQLCKHSPLSDHGSQTDANSIGVWPFRKDCSGSGHTLVGTYSYDSHDCILLPCKRD